MKKEANHKRMTDDDAPPQAGRGILPSPKTAKNVADGDTTAAASDLEDMAGHGNIPFITRKLSSTYVDFGVGLQRKC